MCECYDRSVIVCVRCLAADAHGGALGSLLSVNLLFLYRSVLLVKYEMGCGVGDDELSSSRCKTITEQLCVGELME